MKKIIIITGGNSGLGKATAEILSKNNTVIILGRNKKTVDSTAKQFHGLGIVCDVTDSNQIQNAIDLIIKKYKKIDCLVNCAGVYIRGPFEKNDVNKIKEVISINTLGPMLVSHEVIKYMKKQKNGRIVNVVSQGGLMAKAERAVYNTSKWAMTGFTKCLQLELTPFHISVMGFYPGLIHTDIFKHNGYEAKDFSTAMPVKQCAKVLAYMVEIDSDIIINDLVVQSSNYGY